MNKKNFIKKITIISLLINIVNCSKLNNLIYIPTINQGNYINQTDILKIQIGMKKKLIFSILGTPILRNPFELNKCYYIYYQTLNYKKTIQKTLILTFNDYDTLISIDYETYSDNSKILNNINALKNN